MCQKNHSFAHFSVAVLSERVLRGWRGAQETGFLPRNSQNTRNLTLTQVSVYSVFSVVKIQGLNG